MRIARLIFWGYFSIIQGMSIAGYRETIFPLWATLLLFVLNFRFFYNALIEIKDTN